MHCNTDSQKQSAPDLFGSPTAPLRRGGKFFGTHTATVSLLTAELASACFFTRFFGGIPWARL
jgi:hypothetical protein